MECYLRGDWFETERILVNLLRLDETDVEARLMLATLLRHRRRYDEAARRLEELQGMDIAWGWEWEICRERQLLAKAEADEAKAGQQDEETTDRDVAAQWADDSAATLHAA